MADKDTNSAPRMRPWLRGLLFVSLALNLAVAGVVAGAVLRGGPPEHRRHSDRDFVTPYTRAFDETQRKDLRRALRDGFDGRRDQGGPGPDLAQDYREALDILRADPFQSEALAAILARQSARAEARKSMGQEILGSYLASLTPTERTAYALRLEAEIERLEARSARWRKD